MTVRINKHALKKLVKLEEDEYNITKEHERILSKVLLANGDLAHVGLTGDDLRGLARTIVAQHERAA